MFGYTCLALFLDSLFWSINLLVCSSPISHNLVFYSCIIILEIWWSGSSLFLFFRTILAILVPLPFSINIRIILSTVIKKPCWDFGRNCVKPMYWFGGNWHLYSVASSNLWNISPYLDLWFLSVLHYFKANPRHPII